jgi:3-deoxy-7-phosphoheptulonate synthase
MALLPSYKELKERFSLTSHQHAFIEASRKTICDILNGTDHRLLLIVGPCSIHDRRSAKDFANRLKELNEEVNSHFFLVMRTYFEKPRTSTGWKGFLYDPLLNGSSDIKKGIEWTREFLLELTDMKVPTATEFLDPLTAFYYDDLITWGSIGARTSSSQTHRQFASHLDMPIGFKNGIAGNLSPAINGIHVSSHSHIYLGVTPEGQLASIQSLGNPNGHLVLRGGDHGPNYDPISIAEALKQLTKNRLPAQLLIDCSHQNSEKKWDKQPLVFQSVLKQFVEGCLAIRGLLLESHLYQGSQPIGELNTLKYGVSITDDCLDWDSTQQLIRCGASFLQQTSFLQQNSSIEEKLSSCSFL